MKKFWASLTSAFLFVGTACTNVEFQNDFHMFEFVKLNANCDFGIDESPFSFRVETLMDGYFVEVENSSSRRFRYWIKGDEVFTVNAEAHECSPALEKAPIDILDVFQ